MKKIADMAFEPPPECPTCQGLGYVTAPIIELEAGLTVQGEDVRCPDCRPPHGGAIATRDGIPHASPVDESISPAPPRDMGAGGFLLFAWRRDRQRGGYNDFVGRFQSVGAAHDYWTRLTGVGFTSMQIVLGDKPCLEIHDDPIR